MDDSRPFRPLDAMSIARQILAGDKQGLDWWDRLPVTIRGLEHDGWDAILGRLEELGWHHPGGKDARIKSLRGLSKPLHKFPLRTKDGEKPRRQTYEDWLRLWLILRQIDVDPPALNDLAATIAAALQLPEPPETREHAPTAGREPVSRPWSTPEWRWILAGAGAFSAIAGLLVYFTGHTASPPMEVGLQSKVAAVGAVRPLAPRISPDGRKIAFLDGDELRLADASGGGASGRLSSGVFGFVQWRRDGSGIFFTQRDGGSSGRMSIKAMSIATGTAANIVDLAGAHREANEHDSLWFGVHPAGDRLCFSDPGPGGQASIWEWSRSTGVRRNLTNNAPPLAAPGDTQCAYSPSGKLLAFVRHTSQNAAELDVLDLATGEVTPWVRQPARFAGMTWESEDAILVSAAFPCKPQTLWRLRRGHGKSPALLVDGQHRGDSYAYPSVGGGKLYFQSHRFGSDLWMLDVNSSGAKGSPLASSTPWLKEQPALSPDGEWLVFAAPQFGPSQIWLTNAAATAKEREITGCPPLHADSPRWSGNGWIVYSAGMLREHGARFIEDRFVFRKQVLPGGGEEIRVTGDRGEGSKPVEEGRGNWSADSKVIYFRSNRSGSEQIWKMDLERARMTELTFRGGYEAFEGPNGFVYYVPARGPSELWRVPAAGGAEEPVIRPGPDDEWDGVQEGWWAVNAGGIFAILRDKRAIGRIWLSQFDLEGRPLKTRLPVSLTKPGKVRKGISLSRDGKLYFASELDPASEIRYCETTPGHE